MDTDSAYVALASENIKDLVKPALKHEYEKSLSSFCSDNASLTNGDNLWFPRTCCNKHNKYDQRTPGLFKTEYEGDEMVSLCSKTYVIAKGDSCKFSSKGLKRDL